ncbi:MAG: bifunctional nuclease family protein [Chitinophagales bacterium]|nr:bifunctional nuclease family protein [Chitinophagales bacterium]
MKKIPLEIVALSHSITQTQSYAVVLEETAGKRRLPIVIGGFEAQAIAVALEKMPTTRPLTHDLLRNMFNTFGMELVEIVINNLKEGIFYALLVCKVGDRIEEIDSRTSDAIALAVRFNCPIYTYEFILDSAGIIMDEQMTGSENMPAKKEKVEISAATEVEPDSALTNMGKLSEKQLNELLNKVLKMEDYEKAIRIRDEIERRKKSS